VSHSIVVSGFHELGKVKTVESVFGYRFSSALPIGAIALGSISVVKTETGGRRGGETMKLSVALLNRMHERAMHGGNSV
jgi:hypothetical protein